VLGVYNYTVWLTYASLISAVSGIFVAMHGSGHPYIATFLLMFCGLCDAFDGKVARTKKDRTDFDRRFGIQVDSLADIVAFGVLPACIGESMLRIYPKIEEIPHLIKSKDYISSGKTIIVLAILIFYVLAALIRLAYFNVMEEERSSKEGGVLKCYTGVPVTASSLVFPMVMLLQYALPADLTLIYFGLMLVMGFAFVSKVKVPKPGLRGILILVGIGVVEALILLFFHDGINA